ncbi:MAG: DNA-deoxyinosine glycosylase [Oscillospiraceae bacterium]|nr:DNA-deoxyinosine glycosylase [Oscillospiraceae bacterium]
MYHAFPPLISGRPKILILGTFPSPLSRERGEYYGNPRNMFWRIIFGVFGAEFGSPDYGEKKRLLFDNGIALWDVIESCEIDGALDSAIKNPVYNTALPGFIEANGIRAVAFNGGNAYKFYRRGIGPAEKTVLPSTSPANARLDYGGKLAAWSAAILKNG